MPNQNHQPDPHRFETYDSLAMPKSWPVTRASADPLEIRFPDPSASQLEMFVGEFLGDFGEENAKAVLETATAGRSLLRTPLQFAAWNQTPWAVGEREKFNSQDSPLASKVLEYTIAVPRYDGEEPRESWRTGANLEPEVVVRRVLPRVGKAELSMVASLGDPLPFLDREALGERWALIEAMFRSEKAQGMRGDLSDFVTEQESRFALVNFEGTILKVAPFAADRGAYVLLEANERDQIGRDLETQIQSEDHLAAILRLAGVSISVAMCREICEATRLNSALSRIDTSKLTDLSVPMEIGRHRENEFDGSERYWHSTTTMAFISPRGDLYVTLECDSENKNGKMFGFFGWDSRTVRFSRTQWRYFSEAVGPQDYPGD